MTDPDPISRESWERSLRRQARRLGLRATKTYRRSPSARDYNRWDIWDIATGRVLATDLNDLEALAEWLSRRPARKGHTR
jgi:hypothetical protein